ncbi:MAG: hypothetical protein KAH18_06665 [Psychromonas sp.]|nr:hypothetical protein [Psychromonas sp.]
MIDIKQKMIDECLSNKYLSVQDDLNPTKLLKIPKWLKNTKWTVGAPYKQSSCITVYEDSLTIDVSDSSSVTGLTMLYIDSTIAVNVPEEEETDCTYFVSYSTNNNTDIIVSIVLNKNYTSGKLSFVQYGTFDVAFVITKAS